MDTGGFQSTKQINMFLIDMGNLQNLPNYVKRTFSCHCNLENKLTQPVYDSNQSHPSTRDPLLDPFQMKKISDLIFGRLIFEFSVIPFVTCKITNRPIYNNIVFYANQESTIYHILENTLN